MNVELSALSGSGPGGRIVVRDVLSAEPASASVAAAAPAQPAAAPVAPAQPAESVAVAPAGAAGVGYTDIPNSQMRKVIAKALTESKQNIPHYYLSMECEMDELMAVRKQLAEEHGTKVSVNDFVLKACGCALQSVPQVNAQWGDDAIRLLDQIDIGVAVAIDGGLITPIVTNVPGRGLSSINAAVKDLASRARENNLQLDEIQGATFTVSNLGMFGVSHFTSIIPPGQVGILAVGATIPRVVPAGTDEDGVPQYRTAQVMTVTLSCDHRVVDGAVGATWLQAFKGFMEDPLKMIL
jgi:pyruvate dehydrogenase E2 component (dihydrolipoamide acetyltransferase)